MKMQRGIFKYMQPEQHCTGVYARDNLGLEIDPVEPDAVAWCAQGWCFNATGVYWNQDMLGVAEGLGYRGVCTANDGLGWAFIEAWREAGI